MPDEPDPLMQAIQNAAYGELNHLTHLYQTTEGLENCLHLMTAENLRNIIRGAAHALAELAIEVADYAYNDEAQKTSDHRALASLRPSMTLFSQLQNRLLGGSPQLDRSLNHYDAIYDGFVQHFQSNEDNSEGKAYGAGVVGGIIGSFLGPIGALVGGAVGGMASAHMGSSEVQTRADTLCSEFARAVEASNAYLEHMASMTIDFIQQYWADLEALTGTNPHQIDDKPA
jgi:hypothetical protein